MSVRIDNHWTKKLYSNAQIDRRLEVLIVDRCSMCNGRCKSIDLLRDIMVNKLTKEHRTYISFNTKEHRCTILFTYSIQRRSSLIIRHS